MMAACRSCCAGTAACCTVLGLWGALGPKSTQVSPRSLRLLPRVRAASAPAAITLAPPPPPPPVVRFLYDADEGALEVWVNDAPQGVCWRGPKGIELFPAVACYGTSPTVSLIQCEAVRAGAAGSGGEFTKAPSAPLPMGPDSLATFDTTFDPTTVTFSPDSRTVTSKASGRSMAVAAVGYDRRSYWEFRLDRDVASNECACFGATEKPITSRDYDSETCAWMYRAYNAQLCE